MRPISAALAVALFLSPLAVCTSQPVRSGEPGAIAPRPRATCASTRPAATIAQGDLVMAPLCDDVYVEPGLTPPELDALRSAYETARAVVARAFDQELRSSPLTLFCRTTACKVAFGADPASAAADDLGFARDALPTSDGVVPRSAVVVTGPVGATARILAHELVHAEMKAWVAYDALPTWFDEGVATFVADEPKCDAHPPSPLLDVTTLTTKARWERHLREHNDTLELYCQSRHRVGAWALRVGDEPHRAAALKALMTSAAGGVPFDRGPFAL